ncbi:LacI family DNA-binding transcriptional regulator [Streptomyces sp. N35]|uniref:LacI family DNA-binding transcriptional regulator n=1 Tax=Streptomyces sp. N35 TaxID=2795730 RepID=UPI0018F7C58F|nr:LacI family DNA-binding transcriptional regulator [Streptomyces sp. N35]
MFTARQEEILRAVRRDGAVRVTEVAAQLGVSQMSVRRDINALADLGIVNRVHGGAVLATLQPSTGPAGLARGQGRPLCLGMIVPDPSTYFQQMIQGARAATEAIGAQLRVGFSSYDHGQDDALVRRMVDDRLDGLLLTPSHSLAQARETLGLLSELGTPVVIVERRQEATSAIDSFDYVSSHHEHGALQALRHLVGTGHRRVLMLSLPSPTSHWIQRAFDLAAEQCDQLRDIPRLVPAHPQNDREADAQIEHVLDVIGETGATAVVAHPDKQAVMLIQRARARGWTLPDDLAVVAYDEALAEPAGIPLTTVAPLRRTVGRLAVARLVQRINEGAAHIPQHILVPPQLHIRESTGGRREESTGREGAAGKRGRVRPSLGRAG